MNKDDMGCGIVVAVLLLLCMVIHVLESVLEFVLEYWLPIVAVIGVILLIGFIYWLCTRKEKERRKAEAKRLMEEKERRKAEAKRQRIEEANRLMEEEERRKAEAKRQRIEEANRLMEEEKRRAEERRRLRKAYWAQVNSSPWWQLGIPERVSLVLDVDVLEDFSPEMELWFKMIEGNAKARDWHIIILKNAYDRILASERDNLPGRLSRMQNSLGERLRILHNTRTLGEYMTLEKVRSDVFFTKSVKRKIMIQELLQQNGLELAHEVRSPENWQTHFVGAGSSEITEECLSV